MAKKLPIFYNAILLTCVNLVLRFVSTSFQVHLSGRIGAEGIGLLQLVMSISSLALTAGIAGIRTATMYLTAGELGRGRPENVSRVLRGCFLYSILCSSSVSITVYLLAPYLAQHWVGARETVDAIRTFAAFLPLVCLTGCMTGYFTAANRISTLAAVEIAEQLCYMAVTMAALEFWAGNDAARACLAVTLGSGISACMTLGCLLILRYREHAPVGKPMKLAKPIMDTAFPLALADDLKVGINTVENLMVPRRLAMYPGEISPLAAFGTVCGMVFPVLMFPAAILFALAELLIPELARCHAGGKEIRIRYLAKRSLRIAAIYGFACGGILFLTAEELCLVLYDSPDAGYYLRLYSLLAPMLYCDAIVDAMIKGLGQQKISVRYNIFTSAMDVTLLYLLLPKYGMHGYFFSFLITHLINFALSIGRLLQISRIRIPFYIPAFTAAAGIGGVLGAGMLPGVWARVVSFLCIFFSLLILFRVVSKADLLWIRSLLIKTPSPKGHRR